MIKSNIWNLPNLVDRFNSRYNDVLVKPEIRMPKVGGRDEFTRPN